MDKFHVYALKADKTVRVFTDEVGVFHLLEDDFTVIRPWSNQIAMMHSDLEVIVWVDLPERPLDTVLDRS